jgi:hypothetical protein
LNVFEFSVTAPYFSKAHELEEKALLDLALGA